MRSKSQKYGVMPVDPDREEEVENTKITQPFVKVLSRKMLIVKTINIG